MPEASNYLLSNRELVELIIKEAGVHEGRWFLAANFNMIAGNFGPTPDQLGPGLMVGLSNIGIQRELPGTPVPAEIVVDAAEVNPGPARTPRRRSKPKASA